MRCSICFYNIVMFTSAYTICLLFAVSSAAKDDYNFHHPHEKRDGVCPNNLLNAFSTFETLLVNRTKHLIKYGSSVSLRGGIDYGSELQAMENVFFEMRSGLSNLLKETRAMKDHLQDLADAVKQKSDRIHREKRSLDDNCGVQNYPRSCRDVKRIDNHTRVYTIKSKGAVDPFLAPCDFDTEGGGWTIIQRRVDGSVDFDRDYETYKNGFGNLGGEFWLGLEKIHQMTDSTVYELLISMTGVDDVTRKPRYTTFKVGSEATGYLLSVTGNLGQPGSLLERNGNQKFSTFDNDQDTSSDNCAKNRGGGWWHSHCTNLNLNGKFPTGKEGSYWFGTDLDGNWDDINYLKNDVMMIRPLCDCHCSENS